MAKKDNIEKDPKVVVTPVDEVVEAQAKKQAVPPTPVQLSSGAWTVHPTITIQCSECGANRIIAIQDQFQVTRCVACQKKAQNKKRGQKKTAANRAKREAAKLEEAYRLVKEAEEKKAQQS